MSFVAASRVTHDPGEKPLCTLLTGTSRNESETSVLLAPHSRSPRVGSDRRTRMDCGWR